jgi:hypothetical protein
VGVDQEVVHLFDPRRANIFVAIITKDSINNKIALRQSELVSMLGTKMYAIIEDGVQFDNIKHIPWKMIFKFKDSSEITGMMDYINIDSKGGFYN